MIHVLLVLDSTGYHSFFHIFYFSMPWNNHTESFIHSPVIQKYRMMRWPSIIMWPRICIGSKHQLQGAWSKDRTISNLGENSIILLFQRDAVNVCTVHQYSLHGLDPRFKGIIFRRCRRCKQRVQGVWEMCWDHGWWYMQRCWRNG